MPVGDLARATFKHKQRNDTLKEAPELSVWLKHDVQSFKTLTEVRRSLSIHFSGFDLYK